MRNRLIELMYEFREFDEPNDGRTWTEHLADHLLANGVIVSPCKVGQTGYWVTSRGLIPLTFNRVFLTAGNEWRIRASYFCTENAYFSYSDFGVTVFLDIHKAEKALAERSEG